MRAQFVLIVFTFLVNCFCNYPQFFPQVFIIFAIFLFHAIVCISDGSVCRLVACCRIFSGGFGILRLWLGLCS